MGDIWSFSNNLSDIRLRLFWVSYDKLVSCELGNFKKSIAGHLHYPWILLLHEIEKFPDYCLQKGPVVAKESGVLSHHIHDARCDNCLVLLALPVLTQLQESAQSGDEEGSFLSLFDAATQRADNPRKRVQFVEAEVLGYMLPLDFVYYELFHLRPVVLHQKLGQLSLDFIQRSILSVLYFFSHRNAIFINHDKHFFGLRHLEADCLHDLHKYLLVGLLERRAFDSIGIRGEVVVSTHTLL